MKRGIVASVLGIAASAITVASARGDGIILFDNYDGPIENQLTYGVPAPAGCTAGEPVNDTGVVIGLYAGKGVVTDLSKLTLIATTHILDTDWYGGGWYSSFAYIPSNIGSGEGSTVTFQVRGWETVGSYAGGGTYGTSLLQGASAVWRERDSIVEDSIPPDEMQNGPLQLSLSVVPEPTTFAIGGLGAAALLVFRRR